MKLFGLEIGGKKQKKEVGSDQMMFDDSFDLDEIDQVEVFNRDQNGVLKISGKDYAVGLFWNSASDAAAATSEAKAAAKNPGLDADFYRSWGFNAPIRFGLS